MGAPAWIDHYALFDDVVAVAKKAHAATAGWRAICVRGQRAIGKKVVQPLATLDLDEEVGPLSDRVRAIVRKAPAEVDTLLFGLFDGVDCDAGADSAAVVNDAAVNDAVNDAAVKSRAREASVYTGFYVGGMSGPASTEGRWLLEEPSWLPDDRFLHSAALDALARAAVVARGEAKKAVAHGLRFGAAALLARFAAAGLPYRVIVAFDDGAFAEISGAP